MHECSLVAWRVAATMAERALSRHPSRIWTQLIVKAPIFSLIRSELKALSGSPQAVPTVPGICLDVVPKNQDKERLMHGPPKSLIL